MIELGLLLSLGLAALALALLFGLYFGLTVSDWFMESGFFIALIFAFLIYLDYNL